MKQLVIGNFRIDTVRCEVHRDTDTVSLEPKVMQVLLCLARHQGDVVSYQALLDEVWPDTIVEANALQRCIGQLRKAFQDDAKQQGAIATYPKSGYSLLLQVQWQNPAKPAKIVTYGMIAITLVIIGFLFLRPILFQTQPLQSSPLIQENISALNTPPIELENLPVDFYALYSPDGRYVAYSRPINTGSILQNLWIQNLSNKQEVLLSTKPSLFNEVAWSPDSQSLVYIESDCLDETCQKQKCSALLLLTSPLSENHPSQISQDATRLIDCISSHLHSPQWTHENTLVLIEENDGNESVIKYNLDLATSEILFQQAGHFPQHLAYSKATEKLAITMLGNDRQYLILLSMPTYEVVRINPQLPEITMNEAWYPIWNIENDGLLISSTEGVFSIDIDGSVSTQNSPFIPAIN